MPPPHQTKKQQAFAQAIERFEYKGAYRGVFPVKCNHDRDLIAAIVRHGAPYGFGLEVRGDVWCCCGGGVCVCACVLYGGGLLGAGWLAGRCMVGGGAGGGGGGRAGRAAAPQRGRSSPRASRTEL